jgi:hypothetical protein
VTFPPGGGSDPAPIQHRRTAQRQERALRFYLVVERLDDGERFR